MSINFEAFNQDEDALDVLFIFKKGELVGGSMTGLVGTALGIFRQEGVLALWRGVSPGVTRHIIYTGIRISVYDRLRQHISNSNDGPKSQKQLQLHHRQALPHWNTSEFFI